MLGEAGEVVAVERDIQHAQRQPHALHLLDDLPDHLRQRHAPALNPDQLEVFHAAVVFDNFVRNAPQRALHGVFIHDFGFELEL